MPVTLSPNGITMRPSPLPLYLSRTRRICAQFLRSGQTETNASRRMSLQDEETVDLPATLHCEKSAKPFRVTSLRLCLSLSLSFSQCIRLSFNGLLSATRPHCAGQILSSATELHQIRTGSSLSRPALYLSPPLSLRSSQLPVVFCAKSFAGISFGKYENRINSLC